MAENTILSRIQLKYDTLLNWNASTFILKRGEVAIAEVPQETNNSGLMPPAIGIKVGDGEHRFSLLPWIQAAAGDVYNWAKQPTKPSYQATEIVNLDTYIAGRIEDTDTHYRIIKGTAAGETEKYFLQSQQLGDGDTWTNVSTIDFTDIYGNKIQTLYDWIGDRTMPSLAAQVATQVWGIINQNLVYTDPNATAGQFVTSVTQTGGKIDVQRSALSASDIASGTLPVNRGGTGVQTIPSGEVLIGNGTGAINTKAIATAMEETTTGKLITDTAVKSYVTSRVGELQASITGAMHFKGFATNIITIGGNENPFNVTYTPQAGDVVVYGKQEYIWAGNNIGERWQLLGDEGSYAIKGSIRDSDIAANAAIQQSKIANLTTDLSNKVDKVTGKGLSTNDYTTLEQTKLASIAAGAQVNTIEHIYVNGTEQTIDNKSVNIAIDLSEAGTVKGARVPTGEVGGYEDISIDSTTKKLEMARIAKTGDVADLLQTSGTFLVLNCGTATTIIQ